MSRFQCGMCYFEKPDRRFLLEEAAERPCRQCVSVHHNWIVGISAKIFRMKEHHMWELDANQYYSSASNRYLTYETSGCVSVGDEAEALKAA